MGGAARRVRRWRVELESSYSLIRVLGIAQDDLLPSWYLDLLFTEVWEKKKKPTLMLKYEVWWELL